MQPANRLEVVQAPVMSFVAGLIRATPGTISLGQGMVHYPPPPAALQAMSARLGEASLHRYGHVLGRTALINAFRNKLTQENQLDISADTEVIVTAGSNMAFAHTILAITDPEDEVILLAPYYFNHEMAIQIASCRAVIVPTTDTFEPDLDALERAITPRTQAIVTVSPNNPTGVVYEDETLRHVNALCKTHNCYHISDEAYEYFTFDGAVHFSPGSITGSGLHTVSLYSLSKAYGMAGWRIGYMAVPKILLPALKKIQDTTLICAPLPSQLVALEAVTAGSAYCRQYLGPLADVRTLVLETLSALGPRVKVSPSRGAFYFFIEVDTDLDAVTLTRRLIEDYHVAVIPGTTFGVKTRPYLRIAYGALQRETVAEAIGRVAAGLTDILAT